MESALIGFIGILIGIALNELLRRRNRIEGFAPKIFEKRLEIYEGLYSLMSMCGKLGEDVISTAEYSAEERKDIVSSGIHEVAEWCDTHGMYINSDLIVHCVPILMGIEDIYYISDTEQRKKEITRFRKLLRDSKLMICKESGIADINNLFTRITKAKHKSPIIDYYHSLQKKAK